MKTNCMKTSPQSWEVVGRGGRVGCYEKNSGTENIIVLYLETCAQVLSSDLRNHFGELGSFRQAAKIRGMDRILNKE